MGRTVKTVPVFNEAHRGKLWENRGITSTFDVAEWSALFVALFRPSDSVGTHWVEGCLQLSQSGRCGKESRLPLESEP
jgi:hypothetical protein